MVWKINDPTTLNHRTLNPNGGFVIILRRWIQYIDALLWVEGFWGRGLRCVVARSNAH